MWSTPKITWQAVGDRFNIEDYNRIKNNIQFLLDLSNILYKSFESGDMGQDKNYDGDYYASEFNTLNNNLELIRDNTYAIDIGEKQLFIDNGRFIMFDELNRIETACSKYYLLLTTQLENISTVPFVCGNMIGEVF